MNLGCNHCFGGRVGSREGQSELRFDRYEDWMAHLLTKPHQKKIEATLGSWKKVDAKRSIIVTSNATPAPKPSDVIQYFSAFGVISEFYHNLFAKFYVIRIDSVFPNMKALKTLEGHAIQGLPLKVYDMSAMKTADWESLYPQRNSLTTASEIENIKVQVNQDGRTVTATNSSLVNDQGPRPQAEIVKSTVIYNRNFSLEERGSAASSPASSVSNGFERSTEKKRTKTRSRKKNRKDEDKREGDARREKERAESVPTPPVVENPQASKPKEVFPAIEKAAEVQFRGGFTIGPSRAPVITLQDSPVLVPLPQHNPGPPPIPNILLNHNPPRSQVQNHGFPRPPPQIQNAQRGSRPQIQTSNQIRHNQEFIRQPGGPQIPVGRPGFHNNQQTHYGQRIQYPGPRQQFPQQRMMHPMLPPGAFPNNNNTQNIRGQSQPQQSSFKNEPSSKFINLFYKMVNDPVAVRRSQLCETYVSLPLKDQFREFLLALSLDQAGIRNRERILIDLQRILSADYPHCKVYPFGSFLTGLGDLESDVDVYIDAFGITQGRQLPKSESSTIDILNRCRRILSRAKCPQSNRAFCNQLIPIREARVPILKFKHSLCQINCDLSFENLISVRNSVLILLYMKLHPVVRPLMILIRYWGKFHALTGSNSIKNYALILLVLVFLGMKKIVPTVATLQKMQEAQRKKSQRGNVEVKNLDIIDGWDTSFSENVELIKSCFQSSLSFEEAGSNLVGSVAKLAEEFFILYSNADFTRNAICSYTSEFLPKSLFLAGNEEDLPEALDRYKEWSSRQTTDRRLNIKNPMCVQDPFVLSFNVGAVTPLGILLKFQVACTQTASHLQNSKFESLLGYFIPLPKEIGDNKFMNMQQRQKFTQDLSKEIVNYVKNGTTVYPKTSEDTPDEGETPLHMQPIEKIIHKDSIRFGRGWESFSSFQADKEFQKLFAKEVKASKLPHSPRFFLNKLKLLWIEFVEDFLTDYFGRSLGLEVTREERIKIERTFNPPYSNKVRKNLETQFVHGEKREKKNSAVKQEICLEKVERLEAKLLELGEIQEKIIYRKLTFTAYKPVWTRREKVYNQVIAKLFKEEAESPVNERETKRSLKKKKKAILSQLADVNPLDTEETVTETILGRENGETSTSRPLLKFTLLIKFDCSLVDELPEIFFIFEKVEGCKANYSEGVSAIVEPMSNIIPEYLLYRLKNWLEIGNEAAEPKNGPVVDPSNESLNAASAADTTYEDEYDLVMPPSSSSSECSEPPVLAEADN